MSRRIYVYDRKRTREEWIKYLTENKILPIWRDDIKGNVVIRRLVKIPFGTKHEFSKKKRMRVILELDIPSKEECRKLREIIKSRIDIKN